MPLLQMCDPNQYQSEGYYNPFGYTEDFHQVDFGSTMTPTTPGNADPSPVTPYPDSSYAPAPVIYNYTGSEVNSYPASYLQNHLMIPSPYTPNPQGRDAFNITYPRSPQSSYNPPEKENFNRSPRHYLSADDGSSRRKREASRTPSAGRSSGQSSQGNKRRQSRRTSSAALSPVPLPGHAPFRSPITPTQNERGRRKGKLADDAREKANRMRENHQVCVRCKRFNHGCTEDADKKCAKCEHFKLDCVRLIKFPEFNPGNIEKVMDLWKELKVSDPQLSSVSPLNQLPSVGVSFEVVPGGVKALLEKLDVLHPYADSEECFPTEALHECAERLTYGLFPEPVASTEESTSEVLNNAKKCAEYFFMMKKLAEAKFVGQARPDDDRILTRIALSLMTALLQGVTELYRKTAESASDDHRESKSKPCDKALFILCRLQEEMRDLAMTGFAPVDRLFKELKEMARKNEYLYKRGGAIYYENQKIKQREYTFNEMLGQLLDVGACRDLVVHYYEESTTESMPRKPSKQGHSGRISREGVDMERLFRAATRI